MRWKLHLSKPKDKEVPFGWWEFFRNLLDITDAQNRILYRQIIPPDSSTGRLGILELRALICPHKHMNLVQNLLVRALVAKFWKEPYEKNLFAGNRAT
jgi:uncharacterized protein (DUF2126 family)